MRSRVGGPNGCIDAHNRLLYEGKRWESTKEKTTSDQKANDSQVAKQGTQGPAKEGKQQKSEGSHATTAHAKGNVKEE